MGKTRSGSLRLQAQAERERRRRGLDSKINNRIPQFEFREGNRQLFEFAPSLEHNEVIVAGPAETGKTIAALAKVDALARANKRATGVIVRKVRNDMAATVLKLFNTEFVDKAGDVRKFGGEHVEFYEYPSGTRVYVSGLDRAGKVLSGALDFAYVNQAEELALEDWETLSTRTTGRAGVMVPGLLFGDANPGPPTHWILQREREQTLLRFESRHEDNPRLFDAKGNITDAGKISLAKLDKLTGVRKQRLRYGKWVQAEGVVYEGFDANVHLIPPFEIPYSWRKFRVIDFGLVHPFVCQWWALDEDGRMYRYREIYMTGRTVAEHARQIKEFTPNREVIETTVCDHDAEDRLTLAQNGIPNIPANKAVLAGIGKVQDRLKVQKDKRPRLFFLRDALIEIDPTLVEAKKPFCTEQEIEGYVWMNHATKEQPVKEDDHGMDDMRYAAMYADEPVQESFSFSYR